MENYARPIMYCEIEKYAQAILLSRMDDGTIPFAPIWNDVTTLDGAKLRGLVDIVWGGFPCQDISVAGKGAGLAGKRSGLFSEIIRICEEASPQFIFLENVPAIRTRGSIEVQEELARIGYDTRWCTLSAAEVGANHKRERWFCLAANANSELIRNKSGRSQSEWKDSPITRDNGEKESLAHTMLEGLERQRESREVSNTNGSGLQEKRPKVFTARTKQHGTLHSEWWQTEPDVGRVVDGCSFRVDRIKALGNGVVPLQVKTAFEYLIGIEDNTNQERINEVDGE